MTEYLNIKRLNMNRLKGHLLIVQLKREGNCNVIGINFILSGQ